MRSILILIKKWLHFSKQKNWKFPISKKENTDKKITQKQLEDQFRKNLNIPNDVTNSKAQIQHNDHFFKLSKLLNSFKKNDCETIICHLKFVMEFHMMKKPIFGH